MRYSNAVLLVALCTTQPLLAQPKAAPVNQDLSQTEEVEVLGQKDTRIFELAETVDIAPDSASILTQAVGANVVANGPLSGIAQYRGMSRFRISSQINGAVISPGGPNWMDPPLSYAPAAHLHSLEVYRGIAPVSAGLETIGGVINANTWSGEFSDSGLQTGGRLRTGLQSANDGSLMSLALVAATPAHRVKLSGLAETADDAGFAGGTIVPSEYERNRFDIGYGYQRGGHTFQIDYGRSDTGNAGTPALPMDIEWIDSDLLGVSYGFGSEEFTLNSRLYFSDIDHGMTNYHLRQAPDSGALFRRNLTDAENAGFSVTVDFEQWKLGLDGHSETHNSTISNPNNAMFFVNNFDHAERSIVGLFAERTYAFNEDLLAEIGLRFNHVRMDTRPVDATPSRMGMPPAVALRDEFNMADRSITDENVDWVAKLHYGVSDDTTLYAGVSRKSRSPSYQERYLWLPLQATAGLADGRTYTGNIELAPEIAHEIELGLDWTYGQFSISPRAFYRDIDDYIQGTVSQNVNAIQFVRMMNASTGASNADPLEFNNVDAALYGLDLDWTLALSPQWSVGGVVNYVRGKRDDINDNLYRVAPLNALVAVSYSAPRWSLTLDTFLYDAQDDVSITNSESRSSGYALVNLKGYWQIAERLRLGFGIDNLTDRNYRPHLAGLNRVRGNDALAVGDRLPGYERSVFARIDYEW